MISKFTLLASFIILSIVAFAMDDTLSIYKSSQEKIAGAKITLYKYGNYKPRNIEEAFLVFLTGDSINLVKFSSMELRTAVEFAINKENNLFRYDWGQEGFLRFSLFCIDHYKLYAPELQNQLAIQSFHAWMNEREIVPQKVAKKLRRSNAKLNRQWKKQFRTTRQHLSKAYNQFWKEEEKERKRSRKREHPYLIDQQ